MLTLVLVLALAQADSPEAVFKSAIEDFEFGEHASASKKLRSVLEPIRLKSREDVIVARQYLGACYHLLDDRSNAKKEFSMLLVLDAHHKLDPEVFSPALVQFFEEVRAETGLAMNPPPPPPPRLTTTPPPPPPPTLVPPVKAAPAEPHPFVLSFVPLGVGQFANRHPARGVLFAGAEVGLFATALFTFLSFEGLKTTSEAGVEGFLPEDEDRAKALQTTYLVTFWTGLAVTVLGIVEAAVSHPGDDRPAPVSAAPGGAVLRF